MLAGVELIRKLGGEVVEAAAILEFTDLIGGNKIRENGVPLFTLLQNEAACKLCPCLKGRLKQPFRFSDDLLLSLITRLM